MNPTIQENRLFVFGGTYGNLQATSAILNKARTLGFQPSQMLFTGDLVAYCGDPQATTDMIRDIGCHMIMGNCEETLALDAEDCGCGFDEGSACSLLSVQWYAHCKSSLSNETKLWMGSLPRYHRVRIGNFNFFACHGTPSSINEFVFETDHAKTAFHLKQLEEYDGIISGHCGIPFTVENSDGIWINSGAVGMPANDGTSDVWFSTLEIQPNGDLHITTHRLSYDFYTAKHAMETAGLSNGYMECLESGKWPSMDVLPVAMREKCGFPIKPTVLKAGSKFSDELSQRALTEV